MARRLRSLGLVHPFPSALNAAAVLGLALLAGGSPEVALTLAAAMLGIQLGIGAANDYFDVEFDARSKPAKPIPAGLVPRRAAAWVALVASAIGVGLAALVGLWVALLAAGMLAAGLIYDAFLKRGPWAWAAYSAALPLLPVYAWYGASGELPPRSELLLPLAVLAGPALQLANGLVDVERDRAADVETLAGRLGEARSLRLMAVTLAGIHLVAWLALLGGGGAPLPPLLLVAAAGGLAAMGLALLSDRSASRRERGWQAQALGIALLALGWLAATVS